MGLVPEDCRIAAKPDTLVGLVLEGSQAVAEHDKLAAMKGLVPEDCLVAAEHDKPVVGSR